MAQCSSKAAKLLQHELAERNLTFEVQTHKWKTEKAQMVAAKKHVEGESKNNSAEGALAAAEQAREELNLAEEKLNQMLVQASHEKSDSAALHKQSLKEEQVQNRLLADELAKSRERSDGLERSARDAEELKLAY